MHLFNCKAKDGRPSHCYNLLPSAVPRCRVRFSTSCVLLVITHCRSADLNNDSPSQLVDYTEEILRPYDPPLATIEPSSQETDLPFKGRPVGPFLKRARRRPMPRLIDLWTHERLTYSLHTFLLVESQL